MAKAVAKKVNYTKVLSDIVAEYGMKIPKEAQAYALKYVEDWYEELYEEQEANLKEMKKRKQPVGDDEPTAKEYAVGSIANGLLDGLHMEDVEVTDLGNGFVLQTEKQEFIDVDQETLKKALKTLLTKDKGTDKLAQKLVFLYDNWETYNNQYFNGELSHPLITIDKLNNRTLGNYTHGEDQLGITNHIRFNVHFIALNTDERILETLRHEMIHQWQDEVLYDKEGATVAKDIKVKMVNEDGEIVEVEMKQKKRPKDWHNKDFKDYAKVVGILADGNKCTGNKSVMPEPQSYNRKFICSCIASNGYHMTIWSTRNVIAVCQICKKPYTEIPKGGKVIKVEQSHVEKPGEDAVELDHKGKYTYFKRFESKDLKDEFIEHVNGAEEFPMTDKVEGVYQKGHNKYKEGFTHWVAYNTAETHPDPIRSKEVKQPTSEEPEAPAIDGDAKKGKDKAKKAKAPAKAKAKPAKPAEKPSEEPKVEKPKAPKKKATPKVAQPVAPIVEAEPKEEEKEEMTAKILKFEKKERSYKNAEDLVATYREFGSIKGVAEHFGTAPGTIIYQAKKLGVDFKKVGVEDGEK